MNKTSLKRSLGWFAIFTLNRLRGRSFVPHPRGSVFIETTSHCNLGCRFCSYEKHVRSRTTMESGLFTDVVDQVAAAGFRHLWLTPQTGDVFTDKSFLRRVEAVEASAVPSFSFYTNLIGASGDQIEALAATPKLREFHVSLYGEDEARFVATARRPAAQFERLLRNLDHMAAIPAWRSRLVLTLRTGKHFRQEGWTGPLAERVAVLRQRHGAGFDCVTEYDSWGGLITPDDVAGLDIDITDGAPFYRRGACIRAVGAAQIMADGTVNACACRDPSGALRIGHVREAPLDWILSAANPAYATLLDNMDGGVFPDPCRHCSVYRSVYDHRWAAGSSDPLVSLEELWQLMGKE
jgi:hypothetical protein